MDTAQKQSKGINLLPQEEFAASTLGRILAWLLSTFRIIVIITEVIVMGVFLSRFWLDVRANDLNELIRTNQAILTTTTSFENIYKDLQTKLNTFSTINTLKTNYSDPIKIVTKYLPSDVSLTGIQFSGNSLQIKGNSISEISISQFLVNLKSIKTFDNVTLVGTNTNQINNSLTEFSLKIDLLSKGVK